MSLKDFYFPAFLKNIPVVQLLLSLMISVGIILPFSKTRATLSWLKKGNISKTSLVLICLTGLISTVALIIWAHWTRNIGIGVQMAQQFLRFPKWLILGFGVPLFALCNALAEEAVYRGVMQEALSQVFRHRVVILILQASAFAAIHFAVGFPNGYTGYFMVFFYGLMLGYLRIISQGILAPYTSHVIADLTIGYFIFSQVF